MSADTGGTKYTAESRLLDDDVALTDHALARWRERTPHDCPIGPRRAYERGEDVKHPQVAASDGDPRGWDRVRVYRHGQDWGVLFGIVDAANADAPGRVGQVCATVMSLDTIQHGPSRAYLHSHGPHGGRGDA